MRKSTFDIQLFIAFLLVMVVGVAFVYSASYPSALISYNDEQKIVVKQVYAIAIGAVFMYIARIISLPWLRKNSHPMMLLAYIPLIAVLIIGSNRGGNQSWVFGIQPSEFAKIFLIMVMAASIAAHPGNVRGKLSWSSWLTKPFVYFLVTIALIAKQGDFGTVIIIVIAGGLLLVLSGMKFRYLGVPLLGVVGVVIAVFLLGPIAVRSMGGGQRGDRISAWLHTFDTKVPALVRAAAYQPENSLIAIGSGRLFGVGFCQSRQKWLYLPEPQNDYIFSIMSEELGFLLLIPVFFLPYLWMLFRGYIIGITAQDEFSSTLALGITLLLATQAFVNIAVAMNLLPCMGVTLPLISSGGSSIISCMIMIGLLLNISAPIKRGEKELKVSE